MDKSLLTRATNADESPTAGYLYGEIARMTHASHETSSKVVEFLIARLKKKQPNIKYKTLVVIKQTCKQGRTDFRREMQKHVPLVKEQLGFRGPPDPLKGDEYFRRVREAAKEALEAIFDTSTTANLNMTNLGMASRICGVGVSGAPSTTSSYNEPPSSSSYQYGGPPHHHNSYDNNSNTFNPPSSFSQPNYPSAGGGSSNTNAYPPPQNMSGIGNPMFQDARAEKGFLQGLKEKAQKQFATKELKPNFAPRGPSHPSMGAGIHPPQQHQQPPHQYGNSGAHWGSEPGAPPGSANAPAGWSFATNRGPTSGGYGVDGGQKYDPQFVPPTDPYQQPDSYQTSSYGQQNAGNAREKLHQKSYAGNRKKGRVGGAWSSAPPPSIGSNEDSSRHHRRNSATSSSDGIERVNTYQNPYHRRGTGNYSSNNSDQSGPANVPAMVGTTNGASSDGVYERGILFDLCGPGGLRGVPVKGKLDAFLKNQALSLDVEIVSSILMDEMLADQSATWQVKSKCLCVIEGLCQAVGCEEFADFFAENYSALQLLASDGEEKPAVRDRATKVLHLLGYSSNSSTTTTAKKSSSYSRQTHEVDLLGGFEDTAPSPPAPAVTGQLSSSSSQHNTAPAAPIDDMFSGLQLNSSGSAPTKVNNTAPTNFDPLLDPVPAQSTNNFLMNQFQQQPPNMQMQQQMQQQQHQQQNMMMMRAQTNPQLVKQNSQVIGQSMIPNNYIAKTIAEPTGSTNPTNSSGFGFMQQNKEDSFNFVKDAMKNS